MNMVKKRIIFACLLGIAIVGTALISFRFGAVYRKDEDARYLDFAQGVLAFNHYKDYQETGHFLEQKCYEQALSKVKFAEGTQRMLLAQLLLKGNDPRLWKYVNERDPELLAEDLNTIISSTARSMVNVPCLSAEKVR